MRLKPLSHLSEGVAGTVYPKRFAAPDKVTPLPRRPRYKSTRHGLLVVDKPLGLSSMDVVRRVRDAAGLAKTGHGGTLDPLATGVVVCCLGDATKLVESLMQGTKVYDTIIDLSAFTTTDDREGERSEVAVDTPPDADAVRAACDRFVGTIDQRPPAYSAIHVDGKRAYQLARAGQDVQLDARPVTIHAIDIIDYAFPSLTLRITCGKGVYIRSIARDLGESLNTGGHLASLRRTAVGPFTIDMAVPIERLDEPLAQEDLIPIPNPPNTPRNA